MSGLLTSGFFSLRVYRSEEICKVIKSNPWSDISVDVTPSSVNLTSYTLLKGSPE